jgi:hypothetical protein
MSTWTTFMRQSLRSDVCTGPRVRMVDSTVTPLEVAKFVV